MATVEAHTEPPATPQVANLTAPCEAVRQEASKYNWDANLMTAIAQAESNCRVEATGDTTLTYDVNGRTYGYSVSVFQVRILPGRENCDNHDLATNVLCAYNIYKGQGLTAWSVYSNGKYRQYL